MASLTFIERDKISRLLNSGGYVLDFTNAKYGEFVLEVTGQDLYAKYGLSKGKNLEAIIQNEPNLVMGKLLIELLRYMRETGGITDHNKDLFLECSIIANRLLGRKVTHQSAETLSKPGTHVPKTVEFDFPGFLTELAQLSKQSDDAQKQGYAFERFLNRLFQASGLDPRGPFRILGEQIDGSFVLQSDFYLLEAKWTTRLTTKPDLVVFNEKVNSKSGFTCGLFVSYAGFTDEAIATLATGRTVNIVLMTVQEIAICLERRLPIGEAIWKKVRVLAEEGDFFRLAFDS